MKSDEVIELSEEDSKKLVDAINFPPKPNEKMKALYNEFEKVYIETEPRNKAKEVLNEKN